MSDDNDALLDKIKAWLLPIIGGLLMVLLNMQMATAVSEMKDTWEQMAQMITKAEVANAQADFMRQRVSELEAGRKECATTQARQQAQLISLEQRAAMFDQFMQTRK